MHPPGVGEVTGSTLGPNRVRAKDVKSCTYCCYVRCTTLIVWVGGNALALNRRNSLPCTVRTSRQRSCNQRVGCLQELGSRALGPAKRSGPRLSSTVPWGMTRIRLWKEIHNTPALNQINFKWSKSNKVAIKKILVKSASKKICVKNVSIDFFY